MTVAPERRRWGTDAQSGDSMIEAVRRGVARYRAYILIVVAALVVVAVPSVEDEQPPAVSDVAASAGADTQIAGDSTGQSVVDAGVDAGAPAGGSGASAGGARGPTANAPSAPASGTRAASPSS